MRRRQAARARIEPGGNEIALSVDIEQVAGRKVARVAGARQDSCPLSARQVLCNDARILPARCRAEGGKQQEVVLGQQLRRLLTSKRRLALFNLSMAVLLVASLYPVLSLGN